MKKLLILSAVVFASTAAFAQNKIGFKAGLNLSEARTNDAEENKELVPRTSLHVGLVGDFSLGKNLSLQPQLLFSGRGTRENHEDHKDIYAFNSLELPINLVYHSAGKSGSFFIGGGPSIGYNLSGKAWETDEPDEKTKIEFGSDAGKIRRADLGFNALAGYQLNSGLFFSVNYTRGITNWLNVSDETWRNNLLGISVGYFFGKTKK
ncbi:MAG TPA: porin family protein [Lacibacter sp.]|nr:porin family protein [Lacibacter sp.]HMO87942.1 porin family protein [Lacibacter sp.]HMP86247.1 porin family protein [Lacibacter sp.]